MLNQKNTRKLPGNCIGRKTPYTDKLFNTLEEELKRLKSPNVNLESIWQVPVSKGHSGNTEIKELHTKGDYGVKQKGVRIYFDIEKHFKNKISKTYSNIYPEEEYFHEEDSEYSIHNEEGMCFTPQVCYDSKRNLFHRTFTKDDLTTMTRLCLAYLLVFEDFKKEDLYHPFSYF